MSSILLDSILQKEKQKYPADLSDDVLFEYYSADNILVNYDLNSDEIECGLIDGSRDAGVDAGYIFVNTNLVAEDFKFSSIREPVELELYLIQSKNQDSFKEGPVDKLASSLPLLLDHTKKQEELEPLFKKEVVEISRRFLDAMDKLADKFPKISIRIFYCCKGIEPNETTKAKATALENTLKGMQFTNVNFRFLGSQNLYERSALQKVLVSKLTTTGTPISGANSYVGLIKLRDYLKFISDDGGSLITRIFEANVRAYQGEVEVNREIATSLGAPIVDLDFWWLNNGVTIVADEASYINNQLVIKNPLIVNGLQTSHEIHAFANLLRDSDERSILVRVIVEQDITKRDQIIRATNRQTSLNSSSFRATEQVHRELEDFLLTIGYYYDRRKNAYKREGKPANKIISIDRLAQAILSLLVQEPHTARARPTTAIKSDVDYRRIFSGDKTQQPLEMYGVAVRLLEKVESHLKSISGDEARIYRNNLKFHTLMVLGWAMNQSANLPALRIAQLNMSKMTDEQVGKVVSWVFNEFKAAGAEDKTAKDSSFTSRLKSNWSAAATSV
ncbi:AIPR family protein [Polynucleobacter sp. 71A-WALBACH]|uniref:AIPR family protein n=1 Tax=Polynucleobacter sp. 71A-WALBACH TaxID=2689097 RepID=UPI001C0D6EB4|nr:AIPR family protein [Polynucleobacter sp. 71A-WALBACH]MBU3592912.1 AIPR family protein [Polynucleobacter sp. 71A-WALBACH]